MPDAKLRLKESWESWQLWTPGGFKEDEKAHYRDRWESDFVPWLKGSTDADGKAVVRMDVTAIDGTRNGSPPAERDLASNREYIVELQTQEAKDSVLVRMTLGGTAKGTHYIVRIEGIEKPIYTRE